MCGTPSFAAKRRVLQWVLPSEGLRRVAWRIRASSRGVNRRGLGPRWRLYMPANLSLRNRFLQRATKPREHDNRSHTSSQLSPSANSKITRARRASSARIVRDRARCSRTCCSDSDRLIASVMQASIGVYNSTVQSTSAFPGTEHQALLSRSPALRTKSPENTQMTPSGDAPDRRQAAAHAASNRSLPTITPRRAPSNHPTTRGNYGSKDNAAPRDDRPPRRTSSSSCNTFSVSRFDRTKLDVILGRPFTES